MNRIYTSAASTVVLVAALSFCPLGHAADPLPSWNDGAAKQSIVKFVEGVTREGSPDFVPVPERIATFDNDGTLWAEQPLYFQLFFLVDQVKAMAPQHPEWKTQEPFATVLKGDPRGITAGGEAGMAALLTATHSGMTTDEFSRSVSNWIATAKHPKTGQPFTAMVYKPMLELLDYLRANGFKTFIVSGGGIEFMRPWTEKVYGIPPEQVIGSTGGLKFEMQDGKYVLHKLPNIVLNAAMADSLDYVAGELEATTAKGEDLNKAVSKLLTKMIKDHKRIIFNGNGYSADWAKEAAKRKLLNLKNTVDALPQIVTPEAIKLLDRFKILNGRETHARYEVFLEAYNKTINIEGQLMTLMANRYILPAALEYLKQIGQSVAAVKAGGATTAQGKKLLGIYSKLVDKFKVQTDALAAALDHGNGSAEKHAKYMRDKVVPAMERLREIGDEIEVLTPHQLWPLPTYREMLFVK